MSKQPRDYDAELSLLLEVTRQHCQGLPLPIGSPVQDDTSLTPTLTWVVENSGEHKSTRNANS
jgi:hypothetical protein